MILWVSGLVTSMMLNIKATEIKNKIPDITNVAAKVVLNTKMAVFESRIPDITNLAAKPGINTKATKIENKLPVTTHFVATPEFHRLSKMSVNARIKEAAKISPSKIQVDNITHILLI